MGNVAIITARGGSKRIPKKNIKNFLGKPIITYSIAAALKSELFDYVMVSTDDEEIADVAKKAGAEIPFFRSKKNADDFATTADVVVEVLNDLKTASRQFSHACCLYPTAPFVTAEKLTASYKQLTDHGFDSVFPAGQFSSPIQRAFTINAEQKLKMIRPETINTRSQDLAPSYFDAGQFYWLNTKAFLLTKKIYTDNSGTIILNEFEVQDIDTLMDWEMAELKYTFLTRHAK